MNEFIEKVAAYFKDAPSLRGYINPGELLKAVVSGLGTGTLVGVLQVILASVGLIFAAPVVPYATAALTIAIMIVRSLQHGDDPSKAQGDRDA